MNPRARLAADLVFKSLADPTRRLLFERLLREGELTVRVLTDNSGVSQPAVSKHLGVLKKANLVKHRRAGREVRYAADPKGLAPLMDWITFYSAFWQSSFDRLEDLLQRMDK